MNILITGATGMIGKRLVAALLKKNHSITVISRSVDKTRSTLGTAVKTITWNELSQLDPTSINAVINLAGENIASHRWSTAVKNNILNSRVVAAQTLTAWLSNTRGDIHWYNASAISFYGLTRTLANAAKNTEMTTPLRSSQHSFLQYVAQQCEQATESHHPHIKVTHLRLAPVLQQDAGMLKKITPIFKMGLGGPLGNGLQPFSWIYIEDAVRALVFLLEHPDLTGPVNLCSPTTVTQKEFAKAFAKSLHRPAILPTPECFLKLAYGQMADELLLQGTHAYPEKLIAAHFEFLYPTLHSVFTKG